MGGYVILRGDIVVPHGSSGPTYIGNYKNVYDGFMNGKSVYIDISVDDYRHGDGFVFDTFRFVGQCMSFKMSSFYDMLVIPIMLGTVGYYIMIETDGTANLNEGLE